MFRSIVRSSLAILFVSAVVLTTRPSAQNPRSDFGSFVQDQLRAHAEQLFGFRHPLEESALGPYDGTDNLQAIQVAPGLHVSLVSSAVASAADQIALWPDDDHPTHLFVCDEETSHPAVQRVDLSRPAERERHDDRDRPSSCDPVRRTPWGTIIVAEEAGATGGLYELIDPVHITTPINVTNRATGTTSDPLHLVKRQAVGSLSFESFAIQAGRDDDLRRRAGAKRRQRRRRDLQVRAGDSLPGRRPDHGSRAVAAGIGRGLRAARRGVRLVELGPGRRNRQWRVGGGEPGRSERRRRQRTTSFCETPSLCRGSPGTTGPKTWTSIPSPPRTACSERAGRTPAARATPTAAWSKTAASKAKSCASSRTRRARSVQRR